MKVPCNLFCCKGILGTCHLGTWVLGTCHLGAGDSKRDFGDVSLGDGSLGDVSLCGGFWGRVTWGRVTQENFGDVSLGDGRLKAACPLLFYRAKSKGPPRENPRADFDAGKICPIKRENSKDLGDYDNMV